MLQYVPLSSSQCPSFYVPYTEWMCLILSQITGLSSQYCRPGQAVALQGVRQKPSSVACFLPTIMTSFPPLPHHHTLPPSLVPVFIQRGKFKEARIKILSVSKAYPYPYLLYQLKQLLNQWSQHLQCFDIPFAMYQDLVSMLMWRAWTSLNK